MRELPWITVITPCYNNSDTIHAAIDSVLSQTYEKIEYIVIDDGSENVDISAIRDYICAHKRDNIQRFTVIKNEKNLGTTKTLNIGIRSASGKYIYTLAADDCFYDENVLSDWTEEFIRSGAEVITAKRAVYDENMLKQQYIAPSDAHINLIESLSPRELLDKMAGCNFVFSCCTARTKECYEKIGFLDEKYRLIDDYPINMRLLRNGTRFLFFDRVVIKYRLGGISNANRITKTYTKESNDIFYNEILPFTSDKRGAKKAFFRWKQRNSYLYDKRVLPQKYRVNESRFGKIVYKIVMSAKHFPYLIYKKHSKNTNKRFNYGRKKD